MARSWADGEERSERSALPDDGRLDRQASGRRRPAMPPHRSFSIPRRYDELNEAAGGNEAAEPGIGRSLEHILPGSRREGTPWI